MYKGMIMPCESTLESSYINVDAEFFPCSFTEGTEGWETGISVIEHKNFIENVWNSPRVYQFRNKLLATKSCNKFGCRECPIYKI
jgi:radical SAM protein with 4Fe4S-binding SPASM domain